MKIKMKKVYYCDYCGKHSLRPLEKHELICTMNVNRTCRLCGRKTTLSELISRTYKNIEEIDDAVNCCPICKLAIIRQKKLNVFPSDFQFDLQKELSEWWREKNEDEIRGEIYY